MICLLSNALNVLDEEGRAEVLRFAINEQNPDGGFKDRAGRSDLYYSLFGMVILKGIEGMEQGAGGMEKGFKESIQRLKQYIDGMAVSQVPGFIERCCLVLIQKELKAKRSSLLKSLFLLAKSSWKERSSINLSYRSFVLFLTLDAVFPISGIIKRSAHRILAYNNLDEHSPCSEVAAKIFLRKWMNQKDPVEEKLLLSFACLSGGFKAFPMLNHADMLSTAVALYSLRYAGTDLRTLKPSNLEYIQSNYSGGAFLSGDGDMITDVEYTFYGLLALGTLAD